MINIVGERKGVHAEIMREKRDFFSTHTSEWVGG